MVPIRYFGIWYFDVKMQMRFKVPILYQPIDSGNINEKGGTGRLMVENFNKTTEIIEVNWHEGRRSIAQKLRIDPKTVKVHYPQTHI